MNYKVNYVRNFTDVDDKIIAKAESLGTNPRDLAEAMIISNREDLAALGWAKPTHEPKVSEHIDDIITMIETLVKKGFAYSTQDGDVYFSVVKKNDYGKLSNQSVGEMQSGTRAISASQKKSDLDFALWKSDTTAGASWSSPWGEGRPGWHIECSAMSKRYLGHTFDIHGGGRDLIFPHHENEIAQSEAANGVKFANFWMHSGLLTINKQKMSKSLGNSVTVKQFLRQWHPEVLQLGVVQNHYRSNIDFSDAIFRSCQRKLLYYYETMRSIENLIEDPQGKDPKKVDLIINQAVDKFHEAMCDDFNTPRAVAELHGLMRQANLWCGQMAGRPARNLRRSLLMSLQ